MPTTRITIPVTPAAGGAAGAEVATVAGNALNHRLANRIGSRVVLFVKNADVDAVTVTIQNVVQTVHADDIVTSVPAGKTYQFGPFPAGLYTQPSGDEIDEVQVDLSDPTAVTLWAICY